MLKDSRDLSAKGAKEDIDGYDSDPETHTYSRGIGPGSRKNLTRPSKSFIRVLNVLIKILFLYI